MWGNVARGSFFVNVIHVSISNLFSFSTFTSFVIFFNLKSYIKIPVSKNANYKTACLPTLISF